MKPNGLYNSAVLPNDTPVLSTPPLSSHSLLTSLCHLRQTPCFFSHYVCLCSFLCCLVLAFCLKCQHALTQTGSLASSFFFFPVKHKPYWAAGGYSHIKITVSHPVDLCMCQRVHSQTPANTHGDAHHNRKARWETYTKDSRLFSCVHSHLRWFIMSSICTISVFIDTLFTDIVIPVRSHLLR